ncbi:MFS transporter [Streptomyces eurocidicus]|uniref:MFS family permease n=1 Tax=Streptomyces eurocidicus TaxID=66423 RepID=A0A7W8F0L3_STREU|nr:MFS transporter [Streptomyces eurocidicus]MBB5118758.1 MFS family permease [Streptomyces eurocidicus]MBF6051432.1 MFS transporter [Streptomyces eurocidicus]
MSDQLVAAPASVSAPPRTGKAAAGQVPVLWLALLSTPLAMGANAPVLILPDMARSLGVPTSTATWLVTVFAWAMTVGSPLWAGLIRQRGLRPALLAAVAAVVTGTAVVTTAPWLPLALAGRAVQAVGGAGLVAVAMNLAGSTRRMGVITAGFGILGASGPLLGSLLAGAASWRLSLTLSAVSLVAAPAVWRHTRRTPPAGTTFDATGAGLVVALASALVLIPTAPVAAALAALAVAVPLVLHTRRRPDGFVPAVLLRSPAFIGSALLACAFSTSYFSLLFSLPRLIAQRTPWSTGAIGTGQLVALLIGSALSWLLAAAAGRLGHRAVLTVLLTLGVLAPLTAAFVSWGPLLLLAATVAVFVSTGSNAVLSVRAAKDAPGHQRPSAIGLFVLCYQLGGALGPALAATLVLK